MPIGFPNCCRVFAYSLDASSTFWAPPTISAHSAAVPHSSARLSPGQAASAAPINESGPRLTPSKRISLQRRVWSIVSSGLTVIPLGRPLIRKRLIPSSPSPRVRAATAM